MKSRKIMAAFLAAAMAMTSAAMPVFADEDAPESTNVETAEEVELAADDGIELMAGTGHASGSMTGPNFLAAADETGNIVLDDDVTLTSILEIPDNTTLTIDLAGHMLTKTYQSGTNGLHDNQVIETKNNASNISLTIKDSSNDKTGKLVGPDRLDSKIKNYFNSYKYGTVFIHSSGENVKFVVDGATIQGGSAYTTQQAATAIDIYQTKYAITDPVDVEIINGAKILGGNTYDEEGNTNPNYTGSRKGGVGIECRSISYGGVNITVTDSMIAGGSCYHEGSSSGGNAISLYNLDGNNSLTITKSQILGGTGSSGGTAINQSGSDNVIYNITNSTVKGGISMGGASLGRGIDVNQSGNGPVELHISESKIHGGDYGEGNTSSPTIPQAAPSSSNYGPAVYFYGREGDVIDISNSELYANQYAYCVIGSNLSWSERNAKLSGNITVLSKSENADLNEKNVAKGLHHVNIIPGDTLEITGPIDSIMVNGAVAENADYLKCLNQNDEYEVEGQNYKIIGLAGGGFAAKTKETGEIVGGGNVKVVYTNEDGSTVDVDSPVLNSDTGSFSDHELSTDNLDVKLPGDTLANVKADSESHPEIYAEAKEKLEAADDAAISVHLKPEIDIAVKSCSEDTGVVIEAKPVYHVFASKDGTDEMEIGDPIEFTVDKDVTLTFPVLPSFNKHYAIITHEHEGAQPEKISTSSTVSDSTVTFQSHGLSLYTIKSLADTDINTLIDIELSAGAISPEFSREINQYTAKVLGDKSSIKVKGVSTNSGKTVTVNDKDGLANSWSDDIPLNVGYNTITVKADRNTYTINVFREASTEMSVYFTPTKDKSLYDIVLKAPDSETINRLNTADLTFKLEAPEGVSYQILPKDKSNIDIIDAGNDRYEFHFGSKDPGVDSSGETIIIGQVAFAGYGKGIKFSVDNEKGKTTNAVHATSAGDNIVTDFYPEGTVEGAGTLNINGETLEDGDDTYYGTITIGELAPAKKDLTINVQFPNEVLEKDAAYTKMTVALHSALDSVDTVDDAPIKLGSELGDAYKAASPEGYAQYTVETSVMANTRYTATFTGDGYRTYSVDFIIPESAENENSITVWNNFMDENHTVVKVNGEAVTADDTQKTFLAGDIDNTQKIDLYDLSAAVAYFGRTGMDKANAGGKYDDDAYIRYDLNRDGNIDSKDIAMVLVSWGN